MMSMLRHRWTGLYLVLMGLGAISLFLYGFFPLKYHTGHKAHWDDLPNFVEGVSVDGQEVYNAGEHSVILMVIDGLRYDFVTEEYMPFTGQLMKNKSACIYVSVAEPPTVTMPRIKSPERKQDKAQWRRMINFWRDIYAMMTGSVSTFADVALNFGAPAVKGDSVLRVAAARGRRAVLYGDDTWLRLFPGLWAEADGTTSFYVTDYTEVDNNVTRHLDKALAPGDDKAPSFDFLVLHYLGLDHIGHLEGARSPKIKPKLIEMDEVVKKIWKAMQSWDRPGVLFVCGDHGMRDAGGHGGATPAEVLVPLLVAKSQDFTCPHPVGPGPTVAQVDLAPTISWLLRAPSPGDSTGRLLPCLLPADWRQLLYLLHYSAANNAQAAAKQLGGEIADREFYKQFERAKKQFAQYLSTNQQSAAKIAKEFYEESLDKMAEILTESTVEFDMFAIVIALMLLYAIAIALICLTLHSMQTEQRRSSITHRHRSKAGAILASIIVFSIIIFIQTLSCAITETKSNFCSLNPLWIPVFLYTAFIFTYTFFITKSSIEHTFDLRILKDLNAIDYLLILGTLLHSWTFFGTSFIEEEHMTWYFYWNTLMFFILIRTVMVLVTYVSKRLVGATEVRDKPQLHQKMTVGVGILPKWIGLIALHRYLRTMNQTGDRWLFLPDTADWLNAPENQLYLQMHLVLGTLLTLGICLYNLRHTNNVMQMHSAFTVLAVACIFFYRIASKSLPEIIPGVSSWDTVHIVDVFWGLLIAQMVFEVLSYLGFKSRSVGNPNYQKVPTNQFVYAPPKEKTEDFVYDTEPDFDAVKLNMARSISHIMLNDLMLVVILLMRPHNVIMVPSIYITCIVTSQCVEHSFLELMPTKKSEILDVLSQSLVHLWIGYVFFFYQGNSNSLASVDLSAGYVGLRSYSEVRVAARMGVHAFAAHAIAGAMLYCRLAGSDTWEGYRKSMWRATNIFGLQRVYALVVYCVVASVFRHHLFVWTVFSPKLLYDFVGTVFTVQALMTVTFIVFITSVTSKIAKFVAYKKL